MTGDILQRAIDNNVSWCAAIAASHGNASETRDDAWLCRGEMPPFYPNLITRCRQCDITPLLDEIPAHVISGLGVKDSFATLDLSSMQFALAVEAHWYHRPSQLPVDSTVPDCCEVSCTEVTGAAELSQWEHAWAADAQLPQRLFKADLLDDRTIHYIYAATANAAGAAIPVITAGAVLNVTDDVVGLSNLFGSKTGKIACVQFALKRYPDKHFVGYGSTDELELVCNVGFRALAPLRVWIHL
jgi:hypothetical protein